MLEKQLSEPWLRGTLQSIPAVERAVLHALELAAEDLHHWCANLAESEIHARPFCLPSVAFHLRHIARSLDRLLTYAEGNPLNDLQLAVLKSESNPTGSAQSILEELRTSLENSATRIRAFDSSSLELPRIVGRQNLPTTVAGLLVHVADHTQRHTGQAITTARLLLALRDQEQST
jgi:uncharacterized damage-inducible protein DinB